MRHANPRIQELVEQLQGVLQLLSEHEIVWSVIEDWQGYKLSCTIIVSANSAYEVAFTVSRRVLEEVKYWGYEVGHNKLAYDSKPVDAAKIRYHADPRIAVSTGGDDNWSCRVIP